MQEMRSLTKMKRYMIHERGRGFEFQTNYDMNTEEFWNDLQHHIDLCISSGCFHIPHLFEISDSFIQNQCNKIPYYHLVRHFLHP